MGKILKVLAKGEVPKNTIFSERFVAECCETFHFHVRNVRFEFGHDDFLKLRQALKEMDASYSKYGEPKSHHHLELGRSLLDPDNSSQELSVELCENIYKKYPNGWDSHFHKEDSFIHLHWRNLRMEMSNAEFIEFGRIINQAQKKLTSIKFKTLSEIFEQLDQEGIIYAVLRNWEHLPEKVDVGPHSDLDLLILPDHVDRFDELADSQFTTPLPYRVQRRVDLLSPEGKESYILVDVRQPGDGYYPEELAYRMLNRRVRFKNLWVLHPEDHLVGLAYHIVFHKGYIGEGYPEQLKWLSSHVTQWPFFLFQGNDLTPYLKKIMSESQTRYVCPVDLTVRPIMPMLYPFEQMISTRYLWHHQDQPIFSRVYKIPSKTGPWEIVKQTSFSFSRHEFNILSRLDSKYFPKVWGYEEHEGYSLFREEYIEGSILCESQSTISSWTFDQSKQFLRECITMVKTLELEGVQHKDFRSDNILISSNGPVLLDFEWAKSNLFQVDDPEGAELGRGGRPPDGGPYDPFALGVVLRDHITPYFPEFKELTEVLLLSRSHFPVDWEKVNVLFDYTQEKYYHSVESKFLALCFCGRYQHAEELLPNLSDIQNESISFWATYVRFMNKGIQCIQPVRIPRDVESNEALYIRLIRECMKADRMNQSDNLLTSLFSAYLENGNNVDPSLFVDLDQHFNTLSSIVAHHLIEALYRKGGKDREWLNLRVEYLSRHGSRQEQDALLSNLEAYKNDLTPRSHAAVAQMYFNAGKDDRAKYFASFVLTNDPYFAECAKILAICHEKENKVEQALRWWKHYITLTGGDEASWNHFIQLHFKREAGKQNRSEGRESAVKIIHPDELVQNIKQHLTLNEPQMALSYAKRLRELLPGNAEAEKMHQEIEVIAEADKGVGKRRHILIPALSEATYSEAIPVVKQQIEQLLNANPGSHKIIKEKYQNIVEKEKGRQTRTSIYEDCISLLEPGREEEAIYALEKLLESHPDYALAHNDLGVLYYNKGDKEKALFHYEKAALINPKNTTFQKNLADFYLIEMGRKEIALQIYIKALASQPEDIETLLIVGNIFVTLNKFAEARNFYERALELEPGNTMARQNLETLLSYECSRALNLGFKPKECFQ